MKIGFCVNNFGASQLNYFIAHTANLRVSQSSGDDVILFYQDVMSPCTAPNFSMMPIQEAWGFDGPLVATTLQTAERVISSPSTKLRLFYVHDLEWLRRHTQRTYKNMLGIYRDPSLTLVARSKEQAEAIENAWNRPVEFVVNETKITEEFIALSEKLLCKN